MEKNNWYKQSCVWIIIVLCIVLVIVVPPIIINCVYKVGWEIDEPNTAFFASGMLTFYGSILSFVGTVALGALALWQNGKIRSEANKHNEDLKEENEELKRLNSQSNSINLKLLELEQSKFMPIITVGPEIEYDDHIRESVEIKFVNCGKGDVSHMYITELTKDEIDQYYYRDNRKQDFDTVYDTLHYMTEKRKAKYNEIETILKAGDTYKYSVHKEYSDTSNEIKFVLLLQMKNLFGNEFFEILTFDIYSTINDFMHYNKCRNVTIRAQKQKEEPNID